MSFKEFDLQTFLSEMRQEQNDSHRNLAAKMDSINTELTRQIDDVVETQFAHHTRIALVENFRRTARWVIATLIVGVVTGAVDLIVNHFKGGR